MDGPHFVYPLIPPWTLGLFPLQMFFLFCFVFKTYFEAGIERKHQEWEVPWELGCDGQPESWLKEKRKVNMCWRREEE